MQRMDPFCKHISERLLSGKALSYEVDTFMHIKGLIYKHVRDSNQRFLALVIPRSWLLQYLLKSMINKKPRSQQSLPSCQTSILWKGRNKDICKYINNCALCMREQTRTQVYPLQMTDIPDRQINTY